MVTVAPRECSEEMARGGREKENIGGRRQENVGTRNIKVGRNKMEVINVLHSVNLSFYEPLMV